MVRPDFSDSMSPASCSTAKWADMVGLDTANGPASPPADIGRSRRSCSTRRRVGSDSALNTLFTVLYLANHLIIVKHQRRPALGADVAPAGPMWRTVYRAAFAGVISRVIAAVVGPTCGQIAFRDWRSRCRTRAGSRADRRCRRTRTGVASR